MLGNEQHDRYDVTGKTFVFTGRLQHFTRDQAIGMVTERGGKVDTKINRDTDYLVYGDGPNGSKHRRADILRVQKRSEQWFMAAMMSTVPGFVHRKHVPMATIAAMSSGSTAFSEDVAPKVRKVRVK